MPALKFDSIYRDLKEKIENGTYQPNTMLPSENTLTGQYGCSRNTVRRAIASLQKLGYVQSIHGKGVQILYTPVRQANFRVGGIESFAESARRNNLKTTTKVVQFVTIKIDERTSLRTGFPVGAEAFYIQRVRSIDGRPVILDVNVFLKSEMPELTKKKAAGSIYKYLEDEVGMKIVTSTRMITAERATPVDLKYMDLQDYDFVAVVTSRTFNDKGIQFEWTQSRHRPDYFVFYDTAARR